VHISEDAPGDDVMSRIAERTKVVSGYYQHWEVADGAASAMEQLWAQHTVEVAARPSFVALHARLGDYLHNPAVLSSVGVTSPSWLIERARELQAEVGAEQIRVFTDSPRQFLQLAGLPDSGDLVLDSSTTAWEVVSSMQHAAAFVLSNSTLSWWAAFAARRFHGSGAPVIVPTPWFSTPSFADMAMVFPGWRSLQRNLVSHDEASAVNLAAAG
jgi:hypothetical protein